MRITVVGAVGIVAAVIGTVLLIRHLNRQNNPNTGPQPVQFPA